MATLAGRLAEQTTAAELAVPLDRNRVECLACGHRCPIAPGFAGVCKVRFNRDGKLYAPHGYVNAACTATRSRKKPFFHALPGTQALQFRDAGLRPALRLLPELGVLAGAARFPLDSGFHGPPRPRNW